MASTGGNLGCRLGPHEVAAGPPPTLGPRGTTGNEGEIRGLLSSDPRRGRSDAAFGGRLAAQILRRDMLALAPHATVGREGIGEALNYRFFAFSDSWPIEPKHSMEPRGIRDAGREAPGRARIDSPARRVLALDATRSRRSAGLPAGRPFGTR